MSGTPVLAYLDAGTGAALAAVVASGAVGARALLGNARAKVSRKRRGEAAAAETAETEVSPESRTTPSD